MMVVMRIIDVAIKISQSITINLLLAIYVDDYNKNKLKQLTNIIFQ